MTRSLEREGAGGDPPLQEHAGLVQVYALTSSRLLHETLDISS
jgi:hypothetical protein